MAVYTRLSRQEIESHLKNYSLGELIDFQEIIEGIDNSNFIITTQKGKFILTIFESRINKNELPFFINFKLHLSQKGINCPEPIANNSEELLVDLKGKKSLIVTFVLGSALKGKIEANDCFEVGKYAAKLHLAASGFVMSRNNELGIEGFRKLFDKFSHLLDGYQKDLREEILAEISFLEKSTRSELPSCVAHLDLFPDNVFFNEKQQACGVIDFYFAASEAMIYDFAITVNAWCFDANFNFDEAKFGEMLRGYESCRVFESAEKDFLKVALMAASMRFLLTRLHDMFFTPKDSLVKIKDPQEYLKKLRFFKTKL